MAIRYTQKIPQPHPIMSAHKNLQNFSSSNQAKCFFESRRRWRYMRGTEHTGESHKIAL